MGSEGPWPSASRTISRPHSDRGRALLSKLGLNSGEHRLAVGVDGEAVERGIQLAARSLRTRTSRHEHADTDASPDGEATLRSGVTNDLHAGHNHPLVGGRLQTRSR